MSDQEDLCRETGEHDREHRHHHKEIEVLVNERAVLLRHPAQTGLSLKEAAIAQGVCIQLDFVLSIERGGGKTELVGDDEHVRVHTNERFLAIPNDDNS